MKNLSKIFVFSLIIIFSLNIFCKNSTEPDPGPLKLTVETTDVSEYGGSDGNIDLTLSGGKKPYKYAWSNNAVTEDLANIKAGTYTVMITDADGKRKEGEAEIKQPNTAFTSDTEGIVADVDGNEYKIVKIGDKWWMAENLKVTHDSEENNIISYYYDDDISKVAEYGRLYMWIDAMNGSSGAGGQGIAPEGWHIPSSSEWDTLIEHLGGSTVAGGKMKEEGTDHWNAPNVDATNSSGFSAIGAGELDHNDVFQFEGRVAIFWSSSQSSSQNALYYYLENNSAKITKRDFLKILAYSIRCVKD